MTIYISKGIKETKMCLQKTELSDFDWMCKREVKICPVNDRIEETIIDERTGKKVIKAKFEGEYFLAGTMIDSGGIFYRNNKNLLKKSLVVIDVDDVTMSYDDLIEHLVRTLGKYKFLVYKTAGHTDNKTKVRIVVEPERPMDKTEYKSTVENIGEKISIKYDGATKTWSQHMGLPIAYADTFKDYKFYINNNVNCRKYPVVSSYKENNEKKECYLKKEVSDNEVLDKLDWNLQVEIINKYVELNKENLLDYNFFINALMHLRRAVFLKEITLEEAEELIKILSLGNEEWEKGNISILRQALKNYDVRAKRSFRQFFNVNQLMTNQNNLSLIDNGNYYFSRSYDRNGNLILKQISNFRLKAKEIIKTNVDTFLKTDIECDNKKVEKVVNIKCFNNKRDFLDCILDYNHWFKGKEENIQDIKRIIGEQHCKIKTGVNYIGLHKIDGIKTFVTNTKSVDYKGSVTDNIEITKDNTVIKTNILEMEDITKEELKFIAPYMFKYNTLGITSCIWGSAVGFFLKPQLKEINIKMHHLGLFGESGAGKSATAENIIIPFFSLEEKMLSCADVTQFTLLKNLASSNSIPLILNECKPLTMNDSKKNLLSECLRNAYDGHSSERGNKDQTLSEYPLRAGIIILGEETLNETAIIERSLNIVLSRLDSYKPVRTQAYEFLKENKTLISKFGSSILKLVLNLNNEDIEKEIEIIKNTYGNKSFVGRVNMTLIITMLGIKTIKKLFTNLNLDFEKETKVKICDTYLSIADTILKDTLEGYSNTKSANY